MVLKNTFCMCVCVCGTLPRSLTWVTNCHVPCILLHLLVWDISFTSLPRRPCIRWQDQVPTPCIRCQARSCLSLVHKVASSCPYPTPALGERIMSLPHAQGGRSPSTLPSPMYQVTCYLSSPMHQQVGDMIPFLPHVTR